MKIRKVLATALVLCSTSAFAMCGQGCSESCSEACAQGDMQMSGCDCDQGGGKGMGKGRGMCQIAMYKDNKDLTVFEDASKAIMVSASEPDFMIKLPGNPTTGYTWFFVNENNHLVKMISSEYTADPVSEGVAGSGGNRIWHVHLNPSAFKVPTSLKLHFLYARAWELGGDVKEFTVRTHQDN